MRICLVAGFWLMLASTPSLAASIRISYELPPTQARRSVLGFASDGSGLSGLAATERGTEGFVLGIETDLRRLGDLAGGEFESIAHGVSGQAEVAVGGGYSAAGREAFRWDSTSGMVGLGDLPGGDFSSTAFGVSLDGAVVVGRGHSAAGMEAFVWSADDGLQGLGDLPGGEFSSAAYAVSPDGSTVVGQGTAARNDEAFVWNREQGMRGLGMVGYGGPAGSAATAVSADGSTVVGWSDSPLSIQAFRWDETQGIHGLGHLPGGEGLSVADAVSADGAVVIGHGLTERVPGRPSIESFVWTEARGIESLADVLSDAGLDLSGWQLGLAKGISEDGSTIFGLGTDPSGRSGVFVAVIPEPTTALLVGLGLLGLTRAKTRMPWRAASSVRPRSSPSGRLVVR